MAKNVLILSSSLRKGGNSDLLCDEFVKGVRESGHNAEKIFLKDKSINYCTGCGYCFERTGNCSQKDDMADIGRSDCFRNACLLLYNGRTNENAD